MVPRCFALKYDRQQWCLQTFPSFLFLFFISPDCSIDLVVLHLFLFLFLFLDHHHHHHHHHRHQLLLIIVPFLVLLPKPYGSRVMDKRLYDASCSGDVGALRRLLGEEPLILDLAAASSAIARSPLLIAALRGHADFVREILQLKRELASEMSADGSYPLHAAAGNGYRRVVEELVGVDPALCLLYDGDGHLPVHTAVVKGRSEIAEALINANREASRQLTAQGESVLHLAVNGKNLTMVRFLVEKLIDLNEEDDEFLNLQDEGGKTALDLAVAKKQHGAVKLLSSALNLNATNGGGIVGTPRVAATRHTGNPAQAGDGRGIGWWKPADHPHGLINSVTQIHSVLLWGSFQLLTNQPPGGFTPAGKPPLAHKRSFILSELSAVGIFLSSLLSIIVTVVLHHNPSPAMWLLWKVVSVVPLLCTAMGLSFGALAISVLELRTLLFFLLACGALTASAVIAVLLWERWVISSITACLKRMFWGGTAATSGNGVNSSLPTRAAGVCPRNLSPKSTPIGPFV